MLTQERYQLILNLLNRKRAVTVVELTEALGASEATVRRDLNTLHEMGRLNKVHGGATALSTSFLTREEDMSVKSVRNVERKALLGQYAATLIQDDDFVYIDAGSTTEYLVNALTDSRATFVTNGFSHVQKLARKGLKAYILGGRFKPVTEAVVGAVASANLRKYNFSKCFMGANGISPEVGFTTPDAEEAMLKAEVIARSYMVYVLADHSKFNLAASVTFAELSKACIITDKLEEERYRPLTVIQEVL